MISCKLYGRTGNQLFQIAATIGHALKYGFKYGIPKDSINPELWPKVQIEGLPTLDGSEKFTGYYQESSHTHLSIPVMDDIILDGYWQSYMYFENVIPILREYVLRLLYTNWYTISIHIRRGDYLQYPDKHPVLPVEYYQKAICYIINQEPRSIFNIMVFSDDYEWCKENLTFEKFGYRVCVKAPRPHPEEDLKLMARCQHNIIANSSFSYWAAILNPNPNKIVVSPAFNKWFGEGNKHLDTSDLLPPSWIQISDF